MTLKLCKNCNTMKNIKGKKLICKRCEDELKLKSQALFINKSERKLLNNFKVSEKRKEEFKKNELPSISSGKKKRIKEAQDIIKSIRKDKEALKELKEAFDITQNPNNEKQMIKYAKEYGSDLTMEYSDEIINTLKQELINKDKIINSYFNMIKILLKNGNN